MKLDLDLVRELLIKIESGVDILENVEQSSVEDERISYHCRRMVERKLINAEFDGQYVTGEPELTWGGHDFLRNIRSDTRWAKIKAKLTKVGGTVTLQAVIELAKTLAGL